MEPSGTEAHKGRIDDEAPSAEEVEAPSPFPRSERSLERARRELGGDRLEREPRKHLAPSVDVVVVTHNSRADLERYTPALERATESIGARIIFVDNASADGSAGWVLARERLNTEVVELEQNVGYAGAVNAAAARSNADYLVVLNPDVRVPDGTAIWKLVEYLERHPEAAIAAPRLCGPDGTPQASTRIVPTVPMLLARQTAFGRTPLGRRLGGGYLRPPATGDDPTAVEWALGAALAIRRSDFDRVGGWDERYFLYFEDVDFCFRLRAAGRQVHHVPSISMVHDYRRESRRDAGAATRSPARRAHYRSALRFFRKYPHLALRRRSEPTLEGRLEEALRRGVDITLAAFALLALAPLFAVIALAIKLDSPGSALFRQRRLGHRSHPFTMFKFRTMTEGADDGVISEEVRLHVAGASTWTDHDGRPVFKCMPTNGHSVTRVGRILRRWSLDELPQLVNVLRGEMTLVGYRPPTVHELEHYPEWYYGRFVLKPGLTGIWQVTGRNGKSYVDMVRSDIEYAKTRSFGLDLALLARTIPVLVTRRGAY